MKYLNNLIISIFVVCLLLASPSNGQNDSSIHQQIQDKQNLRNPSSKSNDLPKSIDWRNINGKNYVSPVVNQGLCGSQYAITVTQAIESHAAIKSGELKLLSSQQIISCLKPQNKDYGGCGGGYIEETYDYVQKFGLTSEEKFPYSSENGQVAQCKFDQKSPVLAQIDGYKSITPNSQQSLMKALVEQGPIVVFIDVSKLFSYTSGVFSDCPTDFQENNVSSVLLVGYDTNEKDGEYWIIKQSWGTKYGENGYIRLKMKRKEEKTQNADKTSRDLQDISGMCGILSLPSYPVGARLVDTHKSEQIKYI